jgi:hypothetical protein
MAPAGDSASDVSASGPVNTTVAKHEEIEWNDALEILICNEAEKCAGLSWLHNRSEALYSRRANWMQIPMIVLSTVSGAISVGAQDLFGSDQIASMAVGGVSILVGILGTLNSYFSLSKRAEAHRIGSVQYSLIHRALAIEMSLPRSQRTIPKVLLKTVKDELKRLAEILPRVSDSSITQYKKEIMPKTTDVEHPDVTGDIHAVHPYNEDAINKVLRSKHGVKSEERSEKSAEESVAVREPTLPGATSVEV